MPKKRLMWLSNLFVDEGEYRYQQRILGNSRFEINARSVVATYRSIFLIALECPTSCFIFNHLLLGALLMMKTCRWSRPCISKSEFIFFSLDKQIWSLRFQPCFLLILLCKDAGAQGHCKFSHVDWTACRIVCVMLKRWVLVRSPRNVIEWMQEGITLAANAYRS